MSFPFSAIVGQDGIKLALLLNVIDPAIGGVLIDGPRGLGKSTAARALAELLEAAPFVNLPLGATEDKVLGSLDLQAALQGEVRFSPGLLARADGGILYVDEVNLLPDALVDQLLDVAASGINRVEREAVSHEHPARFSLVGTMNPEEGELRPQLLDRFGLCVSAEPRPDVATRMSISQRRLQFELDPAAFSQQFLSHQQQLAQRLQRARLLLPGLDWSEVIMTSVAQGCLDAHVDGLRADLTWLRAARAYAAWRLAADTGECVAAENVETDKAQILASDVEQVADWVLAHRRQAPSASPSSTADPSDDSSPSEPPADRNSSPNNNASNFTRPDSSRRQNRADQPPSNSPPPAPQPAGGWGELAPQPVGAAADRQVTRFVGKKPLAAD